MGTGAQRAYPAGLAGASVKAAAGALRSFRLVMSSAISGNAPAPGPARREPGRTSVVLLAALACWTIAVPYLGNAIGLDLQVAALTEIVDHVVPGAVALAAAGVLLVLRDADRPAAEVLVLVAAGLAFLAGFWVTSTHVPLLLEAARHESPWGAAIWHSSAGLPLAAAALRLLLRLL